jgi:hypothetical protein
MPVHYKSSLIHIHTRRRTVGKYRLLILDNHGSHVSPEFDMYCKANFIMVLQMPAHLSHYLQPLDVDCYASLKILYGRLVQEKMLAGVNHIDKQDFLPLYLLVRQQAHSPSNIKCKILVQVSLSRDFCDENLGIIGFHS